MSDPGEYPTNSSSSAGGDFTSFGQYIATPSDPVQPLMNLAAVNSRMDSLHCFLSVSISQNLLLGGHQMEMVSSEISSAIQQVILNGAALLAFSQIPNPSSQNPNFQIPIPPKFSKSNPGVEDLIIEEERKLEALNESEVKVNLEVIELDAVEILAEHAHFCEICGKGFKRDANLRMHMRAHGEQFKRPEALAKPISNSAADVVDRKSWTRFSCPFAGCNRNQHHNKFKPLKSVICARNHFKRSHCPKTYSCNRCQKKNFSVLSDLKSHLKNCGESKWRCSCGTTFSRKDKLFGHVALFEGHMPAIGAALMEVEDEEVPSVTRQGSQPVAVSDVRLDDELFDDIDGLLDEFCGFNERCIQEMFGRSSSPPPHDFVQPFYI